MLPNLSSLYLGFPPLFQSEYLEGQNHDHSITSKVNLVDLAGSERQTTAQTSGERLRVRCQQMCCSEVKSMLTLAVSSAVPEKVYQESVVGCGFPRITG